MERRFRPKIILRIGLVLLLTVIAQAIPPPERPTVNGRFDPVNEYGNTPETVDASYGTLVLKWMEEDGLYFLYDWWKPPEGTPNYEQLLWVNPADTLAKNWKFDVYDVEDYTVSWSTAANPEHYFTLDSADWDTATGYATSPYGSDDPHDIYEALIPQSTIPEPCTIGLVSLGGLALLGRRRV